MERRGFLRLGAAATGALALGPDFWRRAYSARAQAGPGPYGSLEGRVPDANGVVLPEGFESRIVGRSGTVVEGTDYTWHAFPDGGSVFAHDDGGWTYVSNSEVPTPDGGGAGALRIDADGTIASAGSILTGTSTNCAGGATPWGTWLSCEETDSGQVWECDPTGAEPAVARPAMGIFKHEAVAADPDERRLYLTEDQPDGRLYRFTPSAWPDLAEGRLDVAVVAGDDGVTWVEVPDPTGASGPTRNQVAESTVFPGGEGIWFDSGTVYFTTKVDGRVHAYHVADARTEVIYDDDRFDDPPLTGVDNITVGPGGDLYVCEDGGNMELVLINAETVAPFLRVEGDPESEMTGCAFNEEGTHLYFSSQRGGGGAGLTYEVRGPFRRDEPEPAAARPTTTLAAVGNGDDGGNDLVVPVVAGAVGLGALAAGTLAWRRRRAAEEPEPTA